MVEDEGVDALVVFDVEGDEFFAGAGFAEVECDGEDATGGDAEFELLAEVLHVVFFLERKLQYGVRFKVECKLTSGR